MDRATNCEAAYQQREKERREWKERWPSHCRTCEGSGGFVSRYDPSPSGVALGQGYMEDFDPCEACDGKCPRCAAAKDVEADSCTACGWSPNGPDAFCPPETECWCYLSEEPTT